MTNLKLKSDEVGWIKYCLIRTVSNISNRANLTSKEQRFLCSLLKKIEKLAG